MVTKKLVVFKCFTPAALWLFLGLSVTAMNILACGPGDHWVDGCAAGTDVFNSTAVVGLDTNLDGKVDATLMLTGPTTVVRGSPAVIPGETQGGVPSTHKDRIPTEITDLNASG